MNITEWKKALHANLFIDLKPLNISILFLFLNDWVNDVYCHFKTIFLAAVLDFKMDFPVQHTWHLSQQVIVRINTTLINETSSASSKQ